MKQDKATVVDIDATVNGFITSQLWMIYPGYRAVRMRDVLNMPWVGVCVPLALGLSWHELDQRER